MSCPPPADVYQQLLPLARFDMTSRLVQYFKAALGALGLPGGPCRPPRMALSDGEREALTQALAIAAATPA